MSACRWLTPDRLDSQVSLFQSGRGNMSRGGGASYTGDPWVNQDGVRLSVSVWTQLQRRIHIALHSNPPKRIEPLIFNEGRWFSCVKTPADQISEGIVNTQALEQWEILQNPAVQLFGSDFSFFELLLREEKQKSGAVSVRKRARHTLNEHLSRWARRLCVGMTQTGRTLSCLSAAENYFRALREERVCGQLGWRGIIKTGGSAT